MPGMKLGAGQLDRLIGLSPAVHYIAKPSGDYGAIFISDGIRAQLGYEPAQFTQDPGFWASRIHPDDLPRVKADLDKLFENDRHEHEYRFLHADGTWRWMHDQLILIRNEDGHPLEIIGNCLDITARKEAEDALRQAHEDLEERVEGRVAELRLIESRLNDAQRMAKIGNWEWDLVANKVWWSEERYRIAGRDPETFEPTRESFLETVHTEDRQRAAEALNNTLAAGASYSTEVRTVLPDGSCRTIHSQAKLISDQEGRPARMIGTAQDITERKRLEAEVKELLTRLDALTQVAFDGIAVTELGVLKEVSELFAASLGYQVGELEGQPILNLVAPQHRSAAHENLKSRRTRPSRITLLKKDGSPLVVEACGTNLSSANGTLRISAFRDISKRVELERQITTASECERRRIGYELHDGFGQELAGISMLLESLYRKLETDQSPHAVELKRHAASIRRVTGELAQVAVSLSPGFLHHLGFKEAIRRLTAEISQHSSTCGRFRCSGTHCVNDIEVATHLYRIAQEAINNAKRHANAQNIEADCACDEQVVRLEVIDDGIGVPPEPDRVDGMGMRSMRYRSYIIDGSLEVKSREGKGTQVLCCCPNLSPPKQPIA